MIELVSVMHPYKMYACQRPFAVASHSTGGLRLYLRVLGSGKPEGLVSLCTVGGQPGGLDSDSLASCISSNSRFLYVAAFADRTTVVSKSSNVC